VVDNQRRNLIKATVGGATALLAGCSETEPEARTSEGFDDSDSTGTDNPSTETEEKTEQPEEEYLSGVELHDEWIHGETDAWEGKTVREFVATTDAIELDQLTNILEENNDRIRAVGEAVKNASEQFPNRGDYEMRHRHIMSALDQAIEQTDWDFDFISNMNYTQTVGETIQYSEIKVPTGETTEDGHDEYAIINGALSPKMDDERSGLKQDHAVQIPGEEVENVQDQIYKQTMKAVRNSSLDGAFPPTDVEAIQSRVDRGADEDFFPSFATLMGYNLFAGGSDVEGGYGFRADEMLVPATKEIHELIDEIGYEQGNQTDENGDPLGTHGRVDLQLAINEEYFKEGYDEVDGPVVIDELEETSDGWDFELREEPDWNWEQGYPA
jgi:uncharacterized protein YukE